MVCVSCDKFPTKSKAGQANHEFLSSLVQFAIRIRAENRAGYQVGKDKMTALQYELLLLVESLFEEFQQEKQNELLVKIERLLS